MRQPNTQRSTPYQTVDGFALKSGAVGALAIGALAVGRLAIGRARIRSLTIDELTVKRINLDSPARASNTEKPSES